MIVTLRHAPAGHTCFSSGQTSGRRFGPIGCFDALGAAVRAMARPARDQPLAWSESIFPLWWPGLL